jgi:hypothetical protein
MNTMQFLLGLAVALFFTACKKDEVVEDTSDSAAELITAVDQSRGEGESNMIQTMSKGGLDRRLSAKNSGLDSLVIPDCATETLDTTSAIRSYEIDFGTTNCLCWDGKNRRGKLRTTWSGAISDSATVITTTAIDFYLNNVAWIYTHRESNIGLSPLGHPMRQVEVTECKILGGDGTVEYYANRTLEHTKGRNTPAYMADDEFLIRGETRGKDRKGNDFSSLILKPLKFNNDCKFISAGSIEFKRNQELRRLEYGDGACDNKAMIYIRGVGYSYELR